MRILVVEDEHRIANSIKKGLVQEGFAVDVSYDGEEGYDLAFSEDYDAVILDLMLPKMDGVAICKNLRKEGKHVPILMLTAKSSVEDRVDGLNAGADDYLPKPFAFSELLARIRAISRRPKEVVSETLRAQDLSVNIHDYEVARAGKKIDLSKKEFSLLEYMLRNKGKILSKEQIMNHVWNYDSEILPNTVEVYIRFLRRKIDEPYKKSKPIIKTVRGFGYKIDK